MDDAVANAFDDPTAARAQYQAAAAGFHALRDAGLCSAALEYNLGNVHFRLGQLGRAILHYRRAAALDPHDATLRANLQYARQRVEPLITATGQQRLARHLLVWHYDTSPAQRSNALVALTILGWGMLLLRLWQRRAALLVAGLVAVAMSLAVATSLLVQLHYDHVQPPAVVVDEPVPLRLGRGEGSDLALKQPLGPGIELRIVDRRGSWVAVELSNGQTGWLPASAVEPI